jgi:outer membrane receptor protein involved in Fe transport
MYPAPRMQRAIHYTLGVEQTLRRDLSFRIEAYIKTMDDLISFERFRSGETVSAPRNDARGNTKGLEFEAAFSDPRVFGWINVAVMRAEEFNLYDGKGWKLSPLDQRKTVTTVFEFRVAERWSVNLRAFYGSGFAYVDDLPGVPDLRMHYPEYKRADARLNYFFPIAGAASTVYLEVLNLFAHRNAFSFSDTQSGALTPDVNLLLPMIVNAGMRVEF